MSLAVVAKHEASTLGRLEDHGSRKTSSDVKENTSRVIGEAAVEVRNMRISKSIGGKLYMGFGLIMAIVVGAFIVNWLAVRHEQTTRALYKKSITMVENLSKLDRAKEPEPSLSAKLPPQRRPA